MTRAASNAFHLRDCFGCGASNSDGLQLTIVVTDIGATATGRFGRSFRGAPGLVHGGVLVTMLDEVMGALPMASTGARVTKSLDVKFRRPVETERDVIADAVLVTRSDRGYRATAELRYADDDEVRAEASAEFVFVEVPRSRSVTGPGA